ncbi:hypothetical protein HCN44_007293 [Aphidius gifuensis]|uniref:HIT-type domain-containing protein n=1 Tax=Aphidius gifuensis TaxID=684658 RepID=A0A835CPB0_APHGI|nr:zinc finger HIT domain-containing protein 3 [Aphidius gifuensis]KAF7988983.1 hypothetical protein HCN44_007293 [Aphidius gifuensis]
MKICSVCETNNALYKCPACKTPYCSIECCKNHKLNKCETSIADDKNNNSTDESLEKKFEYNFPTEDTVPLDKLELLRSNDDVKQCLANPHVRDIIKEILTSPDQMTAIGNAIREPIFDELVGACLRLVEKKE